MCIYSFLVLALDELRGKIHARTALTTQAENTVNIECEVCWTLDLVCWGNELRIIIL